MQKRPGGDTIFGNSGLVVHQRDLMVDKRHLYHSIEI